MHKTLFVNAKTNSQAIDKKIFRLGLTMKRGSVRLNRSARLSRRFARQRRAPPKLAASSQIRRAKETPMTPIAV
jgi:hypothetical protein